jgi:Ca2+-binding RTX toxin-like protein
MVAGRRFYADTITGSSGSDTLLGGNGNDSIDAGSLADSVFGGEGDDTLLPATSVDSTNDTIDGGNGSDWVSYAPIIGASRYHHHKSGNRRRSWLWQLTRRLTLKMPLVRLPMTACVGSSLGNYLIGGNGNDTLDGGNGNDTLSGDAGDDSLVGGIGTDWASYANATGAVTVSLTTGRSSGAHGNDSLSGIENVLRRQWQ